MRRHGFVLVLVWFFLEEEDERIFEVLLLLVIGMEDWIVWERERFEECRQLDLLYIPYIPYILLPYLTIFAHYYYLQSLRTHSSIPKYLIPFVAFPEARRTGVAWHVGDSASLSGGGGSIRDKSCPPHCSRCPSFAARRRHSEASERSR